MLDFAETLQLIEKAQSNDEAAKDKLVNENYPLIKSIVKRYKNKGVEYEDLYQIGSLGFLKAIQNFDKSFNVKFSTYAVPMIAGEIKRYLRDNGIIKVSRSVKQLSVQINKFIEEYISLNYKSPEISVIAEHFNITTQEAVYAMESSLSPLSLYSQVGGEGEDSTQMLIEKIPDDKPIDKQMDYFLLLNIIKELPSRDKKIIILRYFRDKTQREIADILGVSQVQVSRLESKILNQIKIKMVDAN
ncbi:MAG: SigB/SigF/SigG family RNA polymerase sigma factor [Clostridia bacterium]|nr:SigB/SigF/SigG family RNA polymerase sigma factor [Clostridia bacterium]